MLFRLFTILAVLALGLSTWILSSPGHRPALDVDTAREELPGYYLTNAVLTDFDVNGVPTIRLEADRMNQVDHGTEVTLSMVHLHYEAPNGQHWTLVGDTGHVEPGGTVVEVSGNVRLEGDATEHAGMATVLTDTLTYDVPDAIVTTKSDLKVEFAQGALTGRGLWANLKDRTIRIESKVNGHFQR